MLKLTFNKKALLTIERARMESRALFSVTRLSCVRTRGFASPGYPGFAIVREVNLVCICLQILYPQLLYCQVEIILQYNFLVGI
jgi:hypothetical protein